MQDSSEPLLILLKRITGGSGEHSFTTGRASPRTTLFYQLFGGGGGERAERGETGTQGEPVDGSRGRWFAAGAWGRAGAPRINRLPGGLPWTAQHYCPVVSGKNCFQALASRGPSRWPAGCGGRGAGAAGRAPASSGACWRAFWCGMCGCLHSVTKRVLACVRVAVEMPFSSTLAVAAGATERLRGCTVARKIALLAFSIFAQRGVGRR